MTTQIEITMQGFFRSRSRTYRPSCSSLHVVWNRLRRSAGTAGAVDEPLGPSSSALFDVRLGSALDMSSQILCSLSSLDFTPSECDYLCPKITSFAINFAPRRSGRPLSTIILFAHVNFIEQLPGDYSRGPLPSNSTRYSPFAYFTDETFILRSLAQARGGAVAVEEGSRGISDSAVETLTRHKFTRSGGEAENCSVCLETFSDGEEIIPLPCDHLYHESCIMSWLNRRPTCPLCRQEISTTMSTAQS